MNNPIIKKEVSNFEAELQKSVWQHLVWTAPKIFVAVHSFAQPLIVTMLAVICVLNLWLKINFYLGN